MSKTLFISVLILLLFDSCTEKREILFTGITLPSDNISVTVVESEINLTAKKFHIYNADFCYLNDSRKIKFSREVMHLNIKIDSAGLSKLDTVIAVSNSIKQPNILFESYERLNFKRRIVLRDYSLLRKY